MKPVWREVTHLLHVLQTNVSNILKWYKVKTTNSIRITSNYLHFHTCRIHHCPHHSCQNYEAHISCPSSTIPVASHCRSLQIALFLISFSLLCVLKLQQISRQLQKAFLWIKKSGVIRQAVVIMLQSVKTHIIYNITKWNRRICWNMDKLQLKQNCLVEKRVLAVEVDGYGRANCARSVVRILSN